MGLLLGYARASTDDQDAQHQHDALAEAGCYRIFTDAASGALEPQPELDKTLDQIRPGITLVVRHLDRLERSIRHQINRMDALQQRGIELKSLQALEIIFSRKQNPQVLDWISNSQNYFSCL